jgi:hypothetical protein
MCHVSRAVTLPRMSCGHSTKVNFLAAGNREVVLYYKRPGNFKIQLYSSKLSLYKLMKYWPHWIMASDGALCTICEKIPYSKLPSEDEAAYPHQPSLEALSASARQCQLCKLILGIVDELRKSFEDEKSGRGAGRFIDYHPTNKATGIATQVFMGATPNSRTCNLSSSSEQEEKGPASSATNRKDTQSTLSKITHRETESYGVVRPWIFGNWWILHEEKGVAVPQYQLIGIGVRIGKTPYIEDAEGNDKTTVKHRGSQLRMRAVDGEFVNCEENCLSINTI